LGLRIPDSIMESDSQGGVSLFTAFAVVEEIGLDVLKNRVQSATRSVRDDLPVCAGDTADQCGCQA
jgi:hypothetical protein